MKHWPFYIMIFLMLLGGCNGNPDHQSKVKTVKVLDLSRYSDAPPDKPLNLLFIHHSCGGQWLADKGPPDCQNCICKTHPNGGGLRKMLEMNNYKVHEASYNSIIGNNTDIQDWPPKFRDKMQRILRTKLQDELLPAGQENQIVVFKSCFPNNYFPDDASIEKAKDAYNALLPIFSRWPRVLFVAVTAPPLVKPCSHPIKGLIKRLIGRCRDADTLGWRARKFNNWLKDVESGWLSKYSLKNVVVFDYYNVVTKDGRSNWSEYATSWTDSHPNSAGNQKATEDLIPFLNKAVRRAGLSD